MEHWRQGRNVGIAKNCQIDSGVNRRGHLMYFMMSKSLEKGMPHSSACVHPLGLIHTQRPVAMSERLWCRQDLIIVKKAKKSFIHQMMLNTIEHSPVDAQVTDCKKHEAWMTVVQRWVSGGMFVHTHGQIFLIITRTVMESLPKSYVSGVFGCHNQLMFEPPFLWRN